MYPISEKARNALAEGCFQQIHITMYGVNDTMYITNEHVMQGSLSIDRYCVSGNRLELGSAIASELKLTLDNRDGIFQNLTLAGAELFVQIDIPAETDGKLLEERIPLGYFTVDTAPRKLATIQITVLDRMVQFDKPVDSTLFAFPIKVKDLLEQICDICNITLHTVPSALLNAEYLINTYPVGDNLTYRQILAWICEITGSCAYIDWEGKLRLEWYGDTDVTISLTDRYSSDMGENTVTVTGVQVKDKNGVQYLAGNEGYVLNIESNGLIQHSYQELADTLFAERLSDFCYLPFECSTKPLPYLYPLDRLSYVNKHGDTFSTLATHVTYKVNGRTTVKGVGENEEKSGYATANPLTKQEAAIIQAVKEAVNETIASRLQEVQNLNQLVSGSMGLYVITQKMDDGSTKYYLCDKETLEESQNIYSFTADGYAYTNQGWNNGEPEWQFGHDKDGNAIYNKVCAYGIKVSDPNSKYHAKIEPDAFETWYGDMKTGSFNGEESKITKLKINRYAECGRVRMLPHTESGSLIGTNIVFVDQNDSNS